MDFLLRLVSCVILPTFVVVAIVALIEALRNGAANRGLESGAIYCRHCRYDLRGIGDWRCPECGRDPRRIGVLSRTRPRMSMWAWMVVYLSLLPPLALLLALGFAGLNRVAGVFGFFLGVGIWFLGLYPIATLTDDLDRFSKSGAR